MKNLVVNIGLNVGNVEPLFQLKKTTDTLESAMTFNTKDARIHTGQWESVEEDGTRTIIDERVLVVRVDVGEMTALSLAIIFEAICSSTKQDAIAFKLDGVGHIVFNKDYTGERFEFNPNYFVEL